MLYRIDNPLRWMKSLQLFKKQWDLSKFLELRIQLYINNQCNTANDYQRHEALFILIERKSGNSRNPSYSLIPRYALSTSNPRNWKSSVNPTISRLRRMISTTRWELLVKTSSEQATEIRNMLDSEFYVFSPSVISIEFSIINN